MEILLNSNFTDMSEGELCDIDGGSFWGVVGGVVTVIGGIAAIGVGVAACSGSRVVGGLAICGGVATVIGGIASIATNL